MNTKANGKRPTKNSAIPKITTKMVKAGVFAVYTGRYHGLPGDLDAERLVTQIYLAMRAKDDSVEGALRRVDA